MQKTSRALVLLTAAFGLSSTALAQDAVYTGTWSNLGAGVNTSSHEYYVGHSFYDDSVWATTTWGSGVWNSAKYAVPDASGNYTSWTSAESRLQPSNGCGIDNFMISDDGLVMYAMGASYRCNRSGWPNDISSFVWRFERSSTGQSWSTATAMRFAGHNYDTPWGAPGSYDEVTGYLGGIVVTVNGDANWAGAYTITNRQTSARAVQVRESADHLELYYVADGTDGVRDVWRRVRTSTSTRWDNASLPEELVAESVHSAVPLRDGRLIIASNTRGGYGGFDLFISDEAIPSNGDEVLDFDEDGVEDGVDNCPEDPNVDQADEDEDGIGDACDFCSGDNASEDIDEDGYCGDIDNCPLDPNADQADADDDNVGDVCEADGDEDGFIDDLDNCPLDPNPDQGDSDSDGLGDVCDDDDDDDGVTDEDDNCPLLYNADQADTDGDGQGDECDGDDDGDGVADDVDYCPDTPLDLFTDNNGCSGVQFVELQCPAASATNHGQQQSCVTAAAKDAVGLGLLSQTEYAILVRTSAKSR